MAHFKDREQDDFEARTCFGCAHYYERCAILSLHDEWNEEQVTEPDARPTAIIVAQVKRTAMSHFIDHNYDCQMFIPMPKEEEEISTLQRQKEEVRRTLLGEHYFER